MAIVHHFVAYLISFVGLLLVCDLARAGTVLTNWGTGALGFVVDGTSNTIQFTESTNLAICVDHVNFSAPISSITDGTSNTIAFTESAPWTVQAGLVRPRQSISNIVDGTSNTILIGETPSDALCFGDAHVIPPITDGTSNTITFGENSRFDVCLRSVRVGTITDGTSNTIQFGETSTNPVCFNDVQVAPASTVAATEPAPMAILGLTFAALGFARCRRAAACPS